MKISELKKGDVYNLYTADGFVLHHGALYVGPVTDAFKRFYLFETQKGVGLELSMRDVRLRVRSSAEDHTYYLSVRPEGSRAMWKPIGYVRCAMPINAVRMAYPRHAIGQVATHRFLVKGADGCRDVVVSEKPPLVTHKMMSRKAFNLWRNKH